MTDTTNPLLKLINALSDFILENHKMLLILSLATTLVTIGFHRYDPKIIVDAVIAPLQAQVITHTQQINGLDLKLDELRVREENQERYSCLKDSDQNRDISRESRCHRVIRTLLMRQKKRSIWQSLFFEKDNDLNLSWILTIIIGIGWRGCRCM